MATKLIDLIEDITQDDLPTNVFTIEDEDHMVILGKLNEVIAWLKELEIDDIESVLEMIGELREDINNLDASKQDKLSPTQLNAVNSGIDNTKVEQIGTNATNITNLTGRVGANETNITNLQNQLNSDGWIIAPTNTTNFQGFVRYFKVGRMVSVYITGGTTESCQDNNSILASNLPTPDTTNLPLNEFIILFNANINKATGFRMKLYPDGTLRTLYTTASNYVGNDLLKATFTYLSTD